MGRASRRGVEGLRHLWRLDSPVQQFRIRVPEVQATGVLTFQVVASLMRDREMEGEGDGREVGWNRE